MVNKLKNIDAMLQPIGIKPASNEILCASNICVKYTSKIICSNKRQKANLLHLLIHSSLKLKNKRHNNAFFYNKSSDSSYQRENKNNPNSTKKCF
jgi:hypothetical protein